MILDYIFKYFFNEDDEFSIESVEEKFSKTHGNISNDGELDNEKKRITDRLMKLESLNYITKDKKNNFKLTVKSKEEIKLLNEFKLTSYDTKKIFKLVRDKKYLKSIEAYLLNNIKSKEGQSDYNYINKRIKNNIEHGFIKENNDKLEITEKGLIEEEKIKNPHKTYIEEKLEALELKSEEFKREKNIIDEKYSIINELNYSGMIEYMDRKKAKSSKSKSQYRFIH